MSKKTKLVSFIRKEILNEISAREYKKSVSATPSQKSRNAYKVVKKKLSEVEKILEYSGKLNEEMGGWKLNEDQLDFIREKISSIRNKSRNFTKEIKINDPNEIDEKDGIISDIKNDLDSMDSNEDSIKYLQNIINFCKKEIKEIKNTENG